MTRRLLSAALAVLLLAGCAPQVSLPDPLSQAEVKRLMSEQYSQWWSQLFPDEEQPFVDPIEFVPLDEYDQVSERCATEANLAGVAESMYDTGTRSEDAFNRALFICTVSYPPDISDPTALGFYSDAQVDYLHHYYDGRLAPCLRMLGYDVPDAPPGLTYDGLEWTPYWYVIPAPASEVEWDAIDLRCPPPPIGPSYERGF